MTFLRPRESIVEQEFEEDNFDGFDNFQDGVDLAEVVQKAKEMPRAKSISYKIVYLQPDLQDYARVKETRRQYLHGTRQALLNSGVFNINNLDESEYINVSNAGKSMMMSKDHNPFKSVLNSLQVSQRDTKSSYIEVKDAEAALNNIPTTTTDISSKRTFTYNEASEQDLAVPTSIQADVPVEVLSLS